ncbi:M20 family metallo-hydrolase [Natrialba sp. SSL1]|uniref:M20 family metallo-hydrolase n=1 Tax=Natrialba sp. SSL1 TaxID=1869245 RepID=UPI0008F8EDE4|nr:M20 family metallo-hydrolase [Natrialba sp. SSL1]OIB55284.1 Zn-dependent hydrolase [Natrialba sp. SSL1]
MNVHAERLRDDLLANGEFGRVGADEGHGRTVLTGSSDDRDAREYLVERMDELGLDIRIDPVGNIAGRWIPDSVDTNAAPVAAGSHLDSVPRGGIFDGPLGVYAALESVRAMQLAGVEPDRPIDVVSFTEEEGGRFGTGLLGSSVASGKRSVDEALAFEDESGTTLAEHLEAIGFRGTDRLDASDWDAWFELHIEQSTTLEDAGAPVGIVTAITGLTNCGVTFVGEANHAGGQLMDGRTDALVAAAEFVEQVEHAAREVAATESSFAVATVGEIDVEPGARNVIPGEARLSVDIRDVDTAVMDELVDRARKAVARIERERELDGNLERYRTTEPAHMNERCVRALRDASEQRELKTVELPSGGGHDTMHVGRVTDVGMLFAPSRDGISHNPLEWTDWEDCAKCTQVLADALAALSGGRSA